ncbi:MAG: hypothetical protein LBD58_02355 [Treponema sp.]|jgi:hypothetical protein|nr:hypothetical protein [Treponema sp.]
MFFRINWKGRFLKMRNKWFAGLCVLLVFGFVLAGCPTNGGGGETNNEPKTIVITGFNLDSQPDEMGAFLLIDWETGGPAGGGASRDGDTCTIKLQKGGVPWTGTGEYFLIFEFRPGINGGKRTLWVYQDYSLLAINKAVTTVKWSDFGEPWDDDN